MKYCKVDYKNAHAIPKYKCRKYNKRIFYIQENALPRILCEYVYVKDNALA